MRRTRELAIKTTVDIIRHNYELPYQSDVFTAVKEAEKAVGDRAFRYMVDSIEKALKSHEYGITRNESFKKHLKS